MLKFLCTSLGIFVLALLSATELPSQIKFSQNGSFQIDESRFSIQCFFKNWKASENRDWTDTKSKLNKGGLELTGTMIVDGQSATVTETIIPTGENEFQLKFRAKFAETTSINAMHGVFTLPINTSALQVDGTEVTLPTQFEKGQFYSNSKAQTLSFTTDRGTQITVSGAPLKIRVQDNRGYQNNSNSKPTFSVRLGTSPGGGKIAEASLTLDFKIEPLQVEKVDISSAVNAGFADEIAGDGQGGWSDQGPEQDLRMIRPGVVNAGPIPFDILDAEKNSGKGVIVLCGEQHSFTGKEATIALPENQGSVINLLHASAWPAVGQLGSIIATYPDGTTETIPVHGKNDCGNWVGPAEGSNAVIGWHAENLETTVGLYSSSFALKKPGPSSIRFEIVSPGSMWMIVAVTLSNRKIALSDVTSNLPFELKEGTQWARLDYKREIHRGSALDFSFMVDAPAGKYGFVQATPDGSLTFEKAPEKRVRFYGTNLVQRASFLTKEATDQVADYLTYCGYNSVRIHHQDKEIIAPKATDSLTFDPESLDMLDYFFYRMKEKGLYITTDFYTTRKFRPDDNIVIDASVKQPMKVVIPLDRKAFENWKEFARRWMQHQNPYTGLRWGEDPALWSINLVNEENLPRQWTRSQFAVKLYSDAFKKYCIEKKLPESAPSNSNPVFRRFLHEIQATLLDEQIKFVKEELKMKVLVTSINFIYEVPLTLLRSRFDIVDNHQYSGCRDFAEIRGKLPFTYGQRSLTASLAPLPRAMMPTRIPGRPFMVTEFNYGDRNTYRAEGGPLIGAYASLQGWDALYRFAWSHNTRTAYEFYPTHDYNSACEPMQQLSDRIASVMFTRGDVATAKTTYAYTVPQDCFERKILGGFPTSFSNLGLITGIGSVPEGDKRVPGEVIQLSPEEVLDPANARDPKIASLWKQVNEKKIAESVTGQLRLNASVPSFTVASPRTASVTLNGGNLSAGGLKVRNASGFQTITAISLDGKDLPESDSVLVLQLTDIATSGDLFANKKRQTLLKFGPGPFLVQRGSATIELATSKPYHTSALNCDGAKCGEVDGTFENGIYRFKGDVTHFDGGVVGYHLTR